ncbi:MAG: hypothetical protein B6I30_08145 [Desulfobacteraceae bacterium 4572_187]|nr:MAG: hypothetical protein B6I30_08145 [Desulfobacteraceae bacterium 4572_187]
MDSLIFLVFRSFSFNLKCIHKRLIISKTTRSQKRSLYEKPSWIKLFLIKFRNICENGRIMKRKVTINAKKGSQCVFVD